MTTKPAFTQFFQRYALLLAAALCFGAFGLALVLQHVFGMEPCPLCIVQRYFILLCGILAFVALTLKGRPSLVAKILLAASALGGLATAARHMWVQAFPPESQGCLPGLDYMLGQMPLSRGLPMLFRGSADCSTVDSLVFGITIPQASAAVFIAVLALAWMHRGRTA
jgi:protein dithiol:quinone oxidoreductase